MKNIGVITFWSSSSNYGQILQGFALQQFFIKQGHNAFIIKYSSILSKFKDIITLIQKKKLFLTIKDARKRNFNLFKKNISYSANSYYNFLQLKLNPPKVDLLITGSDQVWAYMNNRERRNTYLLKFTNSVKKISYAASFGRDSLSANEINDYIEALQDFELITVREKSAINICKNLGYDPVLVVDPVALHPKEFWSEFIDSPKLKNNGKLNVFVYTLANDNEIFDSLNNSSYNIYYTNPNKLLKKDCTPTINQWLGYIANCDLVITDSYHCSLFSIIFQTNFLTVFRSDGKKMNNRLLTLLSINKFENHYIPIEKIKNLNNYLSNYNKICFSEEYNALIRKSQAILKNIV